jgi:hypothetical protein
MTKEFVRLLCDVYCDWEGLPPTYRVYVNNELFSERTWIWQNEYLEELLQINADPGDYSIRYELASPNLARIYVKNMRVELGNAEINDNILRIKDES